MNFTLSLSLDIGMMLCRLLRDELPRLGPLLKLSDHDLMVQRLAGSFVAPESVD